MKKSTIFEFENYKEFIRNWVSNCPKKGRGQYTKIAGELSVHTTLISQIFNGAKDLTIEQAFKITEHLGLSELEQEYFLSLVEQKRAGTFELKKYYEKNLTRLKKSSQEVKTQLPKSKILKENDLATYYSDPLYIAVKLITSIKGNQTKEAIAQRLNIPLKQLGPMLNFLEKNGLLIKKDNCYEMGVAKTHLEAKSPLVALHHTNWRLKAIENYGPLSSEDLGFTAPLTISKKDFKKVKTYLLDVIKQTGEIVDKTNPEELACLNIDLFKL